MQRCPDARAEAKKSRWWHHASGFSCGKAVNGRAPIQKPKLTQPAAVLAGWATGREGRAEAQSPRPARRRGRDARASRGPGAEAPAGAGQSPAARRAGAGCRGSAPAAWAKRKICENAKILIDIAPKITYNNCSCHVKAGCFTAKKSRRLQIRSGIP